MASPAQEHALSDLGIFNFTISDEARVKYVVCILHHCNQTQTEACGLFMLFRLSTISPRTWNTWMD